MSPMPAHAAFLTGSMATPPIDDSLLSQTLIMCFKDLGPVAPSRGSNQLRRHVMINCGMQTSRLVYVPLEHCWRLWVFSSCSPFISMLDVGPLANITMCRHHIKDGVCEYAHFIGGYHLHYDFQ